jgi:putative ATPase
VLGGVKDIREAVERGPGRPAQRAGARSCSSTRCTASTRRSRTPSCPYVESRASFTFIGATTENPSFEVNGALLSRARGLRAASR